MDPESGNVELTCAGFNDRNLYPRQTPCNQDYLRKLARDTGPQALEDWYNRHVAALYGELKAYDEDGIFIADGSYLFVPNNENYEGSVRLLFDEHNHPVSKRQEQEMTKAKRDRCRWRRCYKAVFLLHCDEAGERFVVVGVRVLHGNESEATALWPLVETFVEAAGRDVMKVLLVDRGFINGPQIGRLKSEYGIDTVIPIRSDMDILEDVQGLQQLPTAWEPYKARHRPPLASQRPRARRIPRRKARAEAAEDIGPSAGASAGPRSARPEQGARADPDRALPRIDQLVGLSRSLDRRALQGHLC